MTTMTDFTGQDFFRDPVDAIGRLRQLGPLVQVKFPIVGTVWMTTTQEMAGRVLKDSATFTLRKEGRVAGAPWWLPGFLLTLANNMLTFDEPDHTRLRSIVDEAFRRRAILDMEPRIAEIAAELANELFSDGSPADLVQRYARKLPMAVICELLGLPLTDRAKFTMWAERAINVTNAAGFVRTIPGIYAIKRYLGEQIEAARVDGGEGLIAELVRVEKEGAQISRDEIVAMVFLLLFAGTETTTHLISGSAFELLKNPELRRWLQEDWSRADLATEEFLRFISPVQVSKPRFVQRDVTIEGVSLKKGEKVMAMVAAANMDPAANACPEKLDLTRKPNRHIAFGTGIHFCLGHQLARIEGKRAIRALFDRWPKLELAVDASEIRWRRRPGLRAIIALPVVNGSTPAVSSAAR
jgi:cytochrome P450 PksS